MKLDIEESVRIFVPQSNIRVDIVAGAFAQATLLVRLIEEVERLTERVQKLEDDNARVLPT